MWDLAKPLIAQVHGYCLAGGSELASACDLVYVADDAEIGYPPIRLMSPPDNQVFPWLMGMRRAAEMMLTGDSISGKQAAEFGFANRSFPIRSEEHTSELQSLMRISYAVFCLNKKTINQRT